MNRSSQLPLDTSIEEVINATGVPPFINLMGSQLIKLLSMLSSKSVSFIRTESIYSITMAHLNSSVGRRTGAGTRVPIDQVRYLLYLCALVELNLMHTTISAFYSFLLEVTLTDLFLCGIGDRQYACWTLA